MKKKWFRKNVMNFNMIHQQIKRDKQTKVNSASKETNIKIKYKQIKIIVATSITPESTIDQNIAVKFKIR